MSKLAIDYAMKKKMSKGGMVKKDSPNWKAKGWTHDKDYNEGVHRDVSGRGESYTGTLVRGGHSERAKDRQKSQMAHNKASPSPKLKGLAEGGEVQLDPEKTKSFVASFTGKDKQPMPEDNGEEGLVDRIMKRFSRGGQVANDVGTGEEADEMLNQFDDLVLDDDLEFHDTGANSGDELGDVQEDEDRKDIVSRIMKSRKKKDKLPSPA